MYNKEYYDGNNFRCEYFIKDYSIFSRNSHISELCSRMKTKNNYTIESDSYHCNCTHNCYSDYSYKNIQAIRNSKKEPYDMFIDSSNKIYYFHDYTFINFKKNNKTKYYLKHIKNNKYKKDELDEENNLIVTEIDNTNDAYDVNDTNKNSIKNESDNKSNININAILNSVVLSEIIKYNPYLLTIMSCVCKKWKKKLDIIRKPIKHFIDKKMSCQCINCDTHSKDIHKKNMNHPEKIFKIWRNTKKKNNCQNNCQNNGFAYCKYCQKSLCENCCFKLCISCKKYNGPIKSIEKKCYCVHECYSYLRKIYDYVLCLECYFFREWQNYTSPKYKYFKIEIKKKEKPKEVKKLQWKNNKKKMKYKKIFKNKFRKNSRSNRKKKLIYYS